MSLKNLELQKEKEITKILNILDEKLREYSLSELKHLTFDDDFLNSIGEIFDEFCLPKESLIMDKLWIDNEYEIERLLDFLDQFSCYNLMSKECLLNPTKEKWKIWLKENNITVKEFDQIIQYLINRENKYWIEVNEQLVNDMEKEEELKICTNLLNYCNNKGQFEYLEEVPF